MMGSGGLGFEGEAATWVGCAMDYSYYGREVSQGLARGGCQEIWGSGSSGWR